MCACIHVHVHARSSVFLQQYEYVCTTSRIKIKLILKYYDFIQHSLRIKYCIVVVEIASWPEIRTYGTLPCVVILSRALSTKSSADIPFFVKNAKKQHRLTIITNDTTWQTTARSWRRHTRVLLHCSDAAGGWLHCTVCSSLAPQSQKKNIHTRTSHCRLIIDPLVKQLSDCRLVIDPLITKQFIIKTIAMFQIL